MWKVIVAAMVLVNCGELSPYEQLPPSDLSIGPTMVYLEEGVEVWEDFDRLLEGLQERYSVPSADFWHLPVAVMNRDTILEGGSEITLGIYYWYHPSVDMPLIRMRKWGGNTLQSPLVHELAHRVDHILNPNHGDDWDPHNENWAQYFDELHDVAVDVMND